MKELKDLHLDNYRTLKKKIDKDTNKHMHMLCSCVGRINIIKTAILPKQPPNPTQFLLKYS